MAHLDRPYGDWPQAVTSVPATAMGLRTHGRVAPGLPANLVIFRGRRYSELLSRPQYDRVRSRTAVAACPVSWEPPGRSRGGTAACCSHAAVRCHAPRNSAVPNEPQPHFPTQVVVRDGRPLHVAVPAYEELDYVPLAVRKGEPAA